MSLSHRSADVPDWIVEYLADRDQERSERRAEAFAKLTERERALVREFAVMGFVRGTFHGQYRDSAAFPRDREIMAEVIDGILSDAGQSMTTFREIAGLD